MVAAVASSAQEGPAKLDRYVETLTGPTTTCMLMSSSGDTVPTLAGVESTISKCLDYLFYTALSENDSSAAPLLLIGSKGSGRTSIAKHVASSLEGDRDILAGTSLCAVLKAGSS